jgi:polysaccharide export outer membrane protein
MSSNFSLRILFYLFSLNLFFFISCTPTKKVLYFNDLPDTTTAILGKAQTDFEATIQKNDQLWITIGGSNPMDLGPLNSANGTGGNSNSVNSGTAIGYLVEADGTIKIPFVGKVKLAGLTRLQAEATLSELFKDYTKNPVVNVRFLNYNFSVLGEVNNKGRFSMISERTTILDAISIAGDLTDLARRENVLIIREENGQRKFARVNLLSKSIFSSPYFYLKTNDVVYVEPVKAKFISRSGVPQYLGIVAVGLSLLITIINLAK